MKSSYTRSRYRRPRRHFIAPTSQPAAGLLYPVALPFVQIQIPPFSPAPPIQVQSELSADQLNKLIADFGKAVVESLVRRYPAESAAFALGFLVAMLLDSKRVTMG